jgi:predicted alpha/beta hydrolase
MNPSSAATPGVRRQVLVGAARLAIQVYCRADGSSPVVVVLPALGVQARYYTPLAELLLAAGCATVLVDLRGQGGSTPQVDRGARFGYRELVQRDIPAVVDTVRDWFPAQPVYLLGHSIGGQLAAGYVTGPAHRVAGLILVAAGTPYYRRYNPLRALWVLAATHGIAFCATVWGYWPGSHGRQSRILLRDWARFTRTGRNPGMPASVVDANGLPVLAVSVEGDYYAPPSAVDHLCSLLPGVELTRQHLTGLGSGCHLDHFRWVRSAGLLVPLITDWLKTRHGDI